MSQPVDTFESHRTTVHGLTVHAMRSTTPSAGSVPVVLVHGLGLSHRYLMPTAERLQASGFAVWVPDLPGFGLSDSPREVLDMPGLADALASWMEAAGLGRVGVLGNSIGCQVIIHLAARHPDRVDRAVLQGPTTPPGERNWFWQLVRWARNRRYDPAELRPIQSRDYHDCGARRLYGTFRAGLRDRPEDVLPDVSCPTLVVRGENDPICRADWAEEIARLLPDGRLVTVPDAAHTMVYTSPDALVRAVQPFLSGESEVPAACAPDTFNGNDGPR